MDRNEIAFKILLALIADNGVLASSIEDYARRDQKPLSTAFAKAAWMLADEFLVAGAPQP